MHIHFGRLPSHLKKVSVVCVVIILTGCQPEQNNSPCGPGLKITTVKEMQDVYASCPNNTEVQVDVTFVLRSNSAFPLYQDSCNPDDLFVEDNTGANGVYLEFVSGDTPDAYQAEYLFYLSQYLGNQFTVKGTVLSMYGGSFPQDLCASSRYPIFLIHSAEDVVPIP